MVVLNVVIIAVILHAAVVLPFLPEDWKDTPLALTIRSALVGLLLLMPALIVIRETQRASTRGTAVLLSPSQFPDLYETAENFGPRCPACARTRATGTVPTSHRPAPPGWCCSPRGGTPETDVNIDELLHQGRMLRGFWVGLAQLPMSHPFTVRRLERLFRVGLFGTVPPDARTRGAGPASGAGR